MEKLIFSLGLILSGLLLGYAIQFLNRNEIVPLPLPLAELRKLLQKTGLLFFMPISFLAAVWIIPFENLQVILLPVIAVNYPAFRRSARAAHRTPAGSA